MTLTREKFVYIIIMTNMKSMYKEYLSENH